MWHEGGHLLVVMQASSLLFCAGGTPALLHELRRASCLHHNSCEATI